MFISLLDSIKFKKSSRSLLKDRYILMLWQPYNEEFMFCLFRATEPQKNISQPAHVI